MKGRHSPTYVSTQCPVHGMSNTIRHHLNITTPDRPETLHVGIKTSRMCCTPYYWFFIFPFGASRPIPGGLPPPRLLGKTKVLCKSAPEKV